MRGSGLASLDDAAGGPVLERLLDRYGIARSGKLGRLLLARVDNETAIRIVPLAITSWDFTARMTP